MKSGKIKTLIDSRPFSFLVQFLIVVSLVSFCLETLPDLTAGRQRALYCIEVFTVACFTVEYLMRLLCSEKKAGYVFSFFGMVDLLAILPFYLSSGLDLRVLRSFRFLRVFQILKLSRYSRAARRFHLALMIAKEELILFGFLAIIILFLSSVGIYYFEKDVQPDAFSSIFHSMWWAVCTLTTVGYGDIFPVTPGGKFFTFCVLVAGLGIVAMPAGLVASALSEARKVEEKEYSSES